MTGCSPLRVEAIAWTQFLAPTDIDWGTDADGGQALAEFAGRACYESWDKPNPATATNATFLRHLVEVGHLSVLEHGSMTIYARGVSRALTHELVRHRHFSYSELSPRHVPADPAQVVEPDAIAADPELHEVFRQASEQSARAYQELLDGLEARLGRDGVDAALRRKQARQAARSVLPMSQPSAVVVTGNFRSWRHFVAMRGSEHADVALRTFAIAALRELQRIAPNVAADFEIGTLPDGSEVAHSPLVGEV